MDPKRGQKDLLGKETDVRLFKRPKTAGAKPSGHESPVAAIHHSNLGNQIIGTALGAPMFQRKCDCGGMCSRCQEEEKLRRKADSAQQSPAPDPAPPIVHEVLRSPGQPLEEESRAKFEANFEQDFSNVRVHADSRAAESARAVHAEAYSFGNHIVFGGGRYAPHTNQGQRLLAHELTHVTQQTGTESSAKTASAAPPHQIKLDTPNNAQETAAKSSEHTLGARARSASSAPAQKLQRSPDGGEDSSSPRHGSTLPYRQATELSECLKIMGDKNSEYCLKEAAKEHQPGVHATAQQPAAQEKAKAPVNPPPLRNVMFSSEDAIGTFDATLDRSACLLTIEKKLRFNFLDNPPVNRWGTGFSPWPPDKAKNFQDTFIRQVTESWSFQHVLVPQQPCPDEPCKAVRAQVKVIPVDSDEHTSVDVGYYTDIAPLPPMGVSPGGTTARLPSTATNVRVVDGSQQLIGVHEFGHMLGLSHTNIAHCGTDHNNPKCYDPYDIMGKGSNVSEADYAPFIYAMDQFTQSTNCKWKVQHEAGVFEKIFDFLIGSPLGRVLGTTAIGAGIGAFFGPLGALIGAGIGLGVGLVTDAIVYFAKKKAPDPPAAQKAATPQR